LNFPQVFNIKFLTDKLASTEFQILSKLFLRCELNFFVRQNTLAFRTTTKSFLFRRRASSLAFCFSSFVFVTDWDLRCDCQSNSFNSRANKRRICF